MAFALALALLCGIIPANSMVASAATTASVKLTSLGRKGSVSFGSKTKSGTWWQMNLNGKKAFCLNLGYTCHTGNTYAAEETHQWDQDTGGEKNGYYAKIIRWYVLAKKRSNKGFVMSQALIWSIAEGRNSESQLKDVIKQVKGNINLSPDKSVNDIYQDIFEPGGDWTASVTYWQKTGNSKSYQRLLTVDADREDIPEFDPSSISDSTYYRQRITVMKKDEDGKGLGGIQFTLDADNLDDLYSFSMTDRDGTETSDADDDNDTSFSLSGYTKDTGRIAFRMTYRLETMEYYYYPNAQLEKMSADEKKKAKKYLTDEMELDEGVDFASDMTKESAKKLMDQEMKEMKNDISNTYTLTENSTGENKDIILDPGLAGGVRITLKKANSWEKNAEDAWPDSLEEVPSDYSKAYITGVTNKYKKASIKVVKVDKYSKDKKAHGDASLEGAEFQLYADASCTQKATVYGEDGRAKTAGIYIVKNGALTTDYLRSGSTYYLKETKAPAGYTLSNDILPIKVDASGVTAEYTKDIATVEFGNQPILGKVAIQKYYSEGQSGPLNYEANTTFQVYLTRKGSYDACDDYERAVIKTDKNGYGITGDLYYGDYTVHQIDTGDVDAIPVDDFPVSVAENGKTYTYPLDDIIFKAYLRILKKDGNTEKQVLKPGTVYEIYRVTEDGEKLVEQTYSNGNRQEKVSRFVTDETGEIMTVKELKSGTYRMYEVDSANGLHITEKYIEVTINSKADNYEAFTDEDGYTHAVVTVTYTNAETYGKLKIYKTGEVLSGFEEGRFVYENRFLKGAVFEIYALEDIVTQDNQGTHWYDKGDLAATITTGEGAEFEKECKGITGYEVDEDGTVTVSLPLGKYHVTERQTPYGYVLPDAGWDVEFSWNNKDEEYVLNATDVTDENGVLRVENTRAKTAVSLFKADAATRQAVSGAVFGIYTKNDIFNVDGEKIVEAGATLGTVTTDSEGKATADIDFPLMSEGYTSGAGETPESVAPALETETPETDVTTGPAIALNSGDYYLKELSVSDSYYLNETEYPVHLEYKDQNTKVIAAAVEAANTQTTTTISKTSVTGSGEVPGCELQITDAEGNVIVSWISGSADSIAVNDKLTEMGYCNVTADVNGDGSLNINGLFHDTTYTLTETRPADGYATADSISFQLIEGEDSRTLAAIVQGDEMIMQEDNIVRMVDDTTKIRLIKLAKDTGEGMRGAKFEVYDSEGNKVMSFTSKEDGYDITGKLAVGETYTFKETKAPKGYQLAKPVKYTVKDTGKVQKISITDKKTPKPHVPQTGGTTPFVPAVILLFALGCGGILIVRRKRVR